MSAYFFQDCGNLDKNRITARKKTIPPLSAKKKQGDEEEVEKHEKTELSRMESIGCLVIFYPWQYDALILLGTISNDAITSSVEITQVVSSLHASFIALLTGNSSLLNQTLLVFSLPNAEGSVSMSIE